jgi:hypothetical protein
MWRKMIVLALILILPASATAGPLKEAALKAGRELASAQAEAKSPGRGRFWTAIALLAGGGALAVLGGVELGDGENEPDDDDDGGVEDGDAAEKVMLGAGVAAAGTGAILLFTGRKKSAAAGPAVLMRPGRVTVTHTVRF